MMREMLTMDASGDKRLVAWNERDEASVAAARATFNSMLAKGNSMITLGESPRKLSAFDPAENIVAVPMMQGG